MALTNILNQNKKLEFRSLLSSRASTVMVALVTIAVVYWLWFGLTQRQVTTDDIISTQVAQGILEHGAQRLPSEYMYVRGYPTHYLVAGAIWIFGLNNFSTMLPSLLMAMGSLWLTYLFARDVLGRPWLGVGACAILVALDMQIFYATSPRMYMTLQFFTMLAFYSAWRGYVRDDKRFTLLTSLAVSAAILAHREAGVLLVSIPVSIVLFTLLTGRRLPSFSTLYSLQTIAGAVVVISVALFRYVYTIPSSMPSITDHGGLPPGQSTGILNLDPINWASHLFHLERALPYGLTLLIVTLYIVIVRVRGRQSDADSIIIFPVLLFIISALGVVLNTTKLQPRLWMFLLPLYALVLSYGIAGLVETFGKVRRKEIYPSKLGKLMLPSLLVGGLAVSLGLVAFAENTTFYGLAAQGYGLPCTEQTTCDESIAEFYDGLRQRINPEDVIITTNSFFTNYHLGRFDGYLRERTLKEGGFSSYESPTDEYYGSQIIDTRNELEELLQKHERVLVIVDQKINTFVSPDARRFVEDNFTEIYSHGQITAYENCLDSSCASAGGTTQ